MTSNPPTLQCVAWQAVAAASGAATPISVQPNDSATWEPSAESACALLVPPSTAAPATALVGLSEAGSPAAYVCAVAWPLFDSDSAKTLTALIQAWSAPGAAVVGL
jgi:hypothetical protein